MPGEATSLENPAEKSNEEMLIRRIRELLYEHGFTINGARNRLDVAEAPAAKGNGKAERKQADE